MRGKRTIRKPTRWSAEEWRRIEAAARARRVPPLRFVREAALGAAEAGLPETPRRRGRDERVHQLARILNNLHQLSRLAEEEADDGALALLREATATVERATLCAAEGVPVEASRVAALIEAGRVLNETAHRANVAEALPPPEALREAVRRAADAARGLSP